MVELTFRSQTEVNRYKRRVKAINLADKALWKVESNPTKHNKLVEQYESIAIYGGIRKANQWLKYMGHRFGSKKGAKKTQLFPRIGETKHQKKTKPKYLACLWCGGDIPKDTPHAKYCSKKCRYEAVQRK